MMGSSTCCTYRRELISWEPVFTVLLLLRVAASGDEAHPWLPPRLGWRGIGEASRPAAGGPPSAGEVQLHHYAQALDHFSYRPESYEKFQQRYALNSRYWGGAGDGHPIFVYAGDEDILENNVASAGVMVDLAATFRGLLLYTEHRYYGKSMPFGSTEEAFRNASTLGYFSSAQALADYAELIVSLKANLSAERCPTIVVGASYGGMLATWFRLKYPHLVVGALAISAPILYLDDITPENEYYVIATQDYRSTSESCYRTIKKSWHVIDLLASKPDGLKVLSSKFHTCRPLEQAQDLRNFLNTMFASSAQYDDFIRKPVRKICNAIDGASPESHILDKIFAAVVAIYGNKTCFHIPKPESQEDIAWAWQTCTDLVIPIGWGNKDSMFPEGRFNLTEYTNQCKQRFGATPRPHWITTEFGGHDIKSVLKRFASNIIFSNGLRDPYSSGGVLQDISDTIVAIYTDEGSHCLDYFAPHKQDPDWLVAQRNSEKKIIDAWIVEYHAYFTGEKVNVAEQHIRNV